MPVTDDPRSQYALTKKLGQGGFGTVYKAQRRSDRKVVSGNRIPPGYIIQQTTVSHNRLKPFSRPVISGYCLGPKFSQVGPHVLSFRRFAFFFHRYPGLNIHADAFYLSADLCCQNYEGPCQVGRSLHKHNHRGSPAPSTT